MIRNMATRGLIVLALLPAFMSVVVASTSVENHPLDRFLTESTVAVLKLDLAQLDIDRALTLLRELGPEERERVERFARFRQRSLLSLLERARVREVYVVGDMLDFQRGPGFCVFVVRGDNSEARAAKLASALDDMMTRTSRRYGGASIIGRGFGVHCDQNCVVLADPETVTRVAGMTPTPRTDLISLVEAAREAAVVVVASPLPDYRHVLAEFPQPLPGELGVDWKRLCLGTKYVRASVTMWPGMSAKIEVATANDEAERLWDRFGDGLRKLAARAAKEQRNNANDAPSTLPIVRLLWKIVARTGLVHRPTAPTLELVTGPIGEDERREILSFLVEWAAGIPATAPKMANQNKMKRLGLAMHNFHNDYRSLPPTAGYDEQGGKLLSWRVYLLPYLGGEAAKLYKEFHLAEPWDSPHNLKLVKKMPAVYQDESGLVRDPGKTRFVAPVGPGFVFDGGQEGRPFREMRDGLNNTILLVEAAPDRAVTWTKPEDLIVDSKNPWSGLIAPGADGFTALMCDGVVRTILRKTGSGNLLGLLTYNGGDAVDDSFKRTGR